MRTLLLCGAVAFFGLGMTDRAHAQRGVGRGVYSSGQGYAGGQGYYGGSYYRGFGNSYISPYGGYGYGNFNISPYRGYGYGNYNVSPYGGYYGNSYVYPNQYGNGYSSSYYTPSYSDSRQISPAAYQQAPSSGQTVIRVLVSDPDAVVLFDGQKTSSLGRERMFYAPNMEAGYTYSYHVTASWTQDGRTVNEGRTVRFVLGQSSVVDFTRAAPAESLTQPAKTSLSR